MPHAAPTSHELRTAYRHLSQLALHAVHHAKPARYTIRTRLRLAFRLSPPTSYDPIRIRNTCIFLYNAANHSSREHRVLRTLLFTWYWDVGEDSTLGTSRGRDLRELSGWERQRRVVGRRAEEVASRKGGEEVRFIRGVKMDQFRFLVRMLNESMGLCLR